MNYYFFIAGVLCFILGIVHSILGEYLIFKSKRKGSSLVPSIGSKDLREAHLRIIWATWHLASVFGWGFGVILIKLSTKDLDTNVLHNYIIYSIVSSVILGGLLVLIGTKAKHPGWIVLFLIGILLLIGN